MAWSGYWSMRRRGGSRLTEDEVIANVIVTMVGGQETTTNLIGNGLLTLIRNPAALAQLRDDPSIIEPRSKSCCATKAQASIRHGSRRGSHARR